MKTRLQISVFIAFLNDSELSEQSCQISTKSVRIRCVVVDQDGQFNMERHDYMEICVEMSGNFGATSLEERWRLSQIT